MVLAMSRPWRDPITGIWYLRKRVPKAIVPLVGRTVVKLSLGTKALIEAKLRFPSALAKLEAEWAKLKAGPPLPAAAATNAVETPTFRKTLTEREAHEHAAWVYDYLLGVKRERPEAYPLWSTDLFDQLWPELHPVRFDAHDWKAWEADRNPRPYHTMLMRDWCLEQADEVASIRDWMLDEPDRLRLAVAIGISAQRVHLALERVRSGEADPSVVFASLVRKPPCVERKGSDGAKVTITQILEGWWNEAKVAGRKPSTYESYGNSTNHLIRFLKHDDATRVTPENIVAFKDYRLVTPSSKTGRVPSAKTVKDSDLAALKTIFGWAVMNHKLPVNPAAGLTIKLGKVPRLRDPGFTDAEAQNILAAAYRYTNENEHPATAAAKRWVPWLCAFTGARVGELAQLRQQDLRRVGDDWIIQITPEAGTQKTNEARDVPLHPQLVELGFPTFVETCREGPLFLTPARDGDVLGPLQSVKNRLAEFGRSIVADPNVAPNHGWRHRFKAVGLESGIDSRVLNTIQGHAARSVSDSYGRVTLKTMVAAIRKLPSFSIDKSEVGAVR